MTREAEWKRSGRPELEERMSTTNDCPRCGHLIPNDEQPGAYPGALSRADNKTEVCSDCGTHEAMEQFTSDDHTVTPISEWPVPEYREVTA